MAVRVTDEQVAAITGVAVTVRDPAPFIELAYVLVDEHLADQGLSANVLCQIELFLAAHFFTLTEERGGLVRSAVGESSETYADIYKGGFKSTRFGQQAITLDTSGVLANLSSTAANPKARLTLV